MADKADPYLDAANEPDPDADPADAFARVKPESINPDPTETSKPRKDRKSKKTRAPIVERIEVAPPPDDEGMDPLDAAEEIMGMADGIYSVIAMIRGYPPEVQLPDGTIMPLPDPKAKERAKRALARLMKSVGATMSPGAGAAFSVFGCYGAPILAFEMSRVIAAKQKG